MTSDTFDELVQTALFSGDDAAVNAIRNGATPAEQERAAMKAGLAALIGLGMIEVTDMGTWPELRRIGWTKEEVTE